MSLTNPSNYQSATQKFIQSINQSLSIHSLTLTIETPQSVSRLLQKHDRLVDSPFVSLELERLIVESFVDDVYDGELECISLRRLLVTRSIEQSDDQNNQSNSPSGSPLVDLSEVVSFCFFRRLTHKEANTWLKPELSRWIDQSTDQPASHNGLTYDDSRDTSASSSNTQSVGQSNDPAMEESELQLVESIDWKTDHTGLKSIIEQRLHQSNNQSKSQSLARSLNQLINVDHWLKIELLSTFPKYRRHGYASLLLSCLSLIAWIDAGNMSTNPSIVPRSHSILHVAGGSHSPSNNQSNTSAESFYTRLGFHYVPDRLINQPNKNVWISLDSGLNVARRWLHAYQIQHNQSLELSNDQTNNQTHKTLTYE